MNSIISGRFKIAVVINGEDISVLKAGSKELHPYSRSQVKMILSEDKNINFIESVDINEVKKSLDLAVDKEWIIHLILGVLDGDLNYELRCKASRAIESYLEDERLCHYLRSVIYAQPLPVGADLRAAVHIAHDESLYNLSNCLECVERFQERVSIVWSSWLSIPDSHFSNLEDKQYARARMVHECLTLELVEGKGVIEFILKNKNNKLFVDYKDVFYSWMRGVVAKGGLWWDDDRISNKSDVREIVDVEASFSSGINKASWLDVMRTPHMYNLETAKLYVSTCNFNAQEISEDFIFGDGILIGALFGHYRPKMEMWTENIVGDLIRGGVKRNLDEEAKNIVVQCCNSLIMPSVPGKGSLWSGVGASSFEPWLRKNIRKNAKGFVKILFSHKWETATEDVYAGQVKVLPKHEENGERSILRIVESVRGKLTEEEKMALVVRQSERFISSGVARQVGMNEVDVYRFYSKAILKIREDGLKRVEF